MDLNFWGEVLLHGHLQVFINFKSEAGHFRATGNWLITNFDDLSDVNVVGVDNQAVDARNGIDQWLGKSRTRHSCDHTEREKNVP